MNPISINKSIRLKLDLLLHINRRDDYGLIAPTAYLALDTILLSKQNLYMEENTCIRGAMILNPRSKFIMRRRSFASYNLCVCPGNHMVVRGMWKYEVTDKVKNQVDIEHHYDKDIIVDEDVWMGINVTLLNGVHIGRGCIVGAGCVVSNDIPPYSVVVGNPARVVKFVFTPEEIVEHEAKLYPLEKRIPLKTLRSNYEEWKKTTK